MNKTQEFFSGLVEIGQKQQGIKSSEWWNSVKPSDKIIYALEEELKAAYNKGFREGFSHLYTVQGWLTMTPIKKSNQREIRKWVENLIAKVEKELK